MTEDVLAPYRRLRDTAAAYHLARIERIAAERRAREWLCEEQRLAHKLWRARNEPDGA